MAISSNRSASPKSNHSNLDSRPPEAARRSFNGHPLVRPSRSFNPSTPANSPADLTRKSREGVPALLRSSYDSKENEKDQKRVKQCKSFMAPTISAMSKISPSPKKKVLSERNETVRSSISESAEFSKMVVDLSDVEEADNPKSDVGFYSQLAPEHKSSSFKPRIIEFQEVETNSIALVTQSSTITAPLRTSQFKPDSAVEFTAVKEVNLKPNATHKPSNASPGLPLPDGEPSFQHFEFKSNSNSKVNPSSSPSPLAPLDSDPHVPPYDPTTNFTSPRPKFLHFRPRPRIEVLLKKERGVGLDEGKKLEDSFTSESCSSDTENTDGSLSSPSFKESEDGNCSELISDEDESRICESDCTQSLKPKSRSVIRFKMLPFILVVVIACVYFPVTDTPLHSPASHKDHTFKLEYAKSNFDEIASNLKLLSTKTVSYLSRLIFVPRGVEEQGNLYFSNITMEPLVYDEYQFSKYDFTGGNDQIDLEVDMEAETVASQREEQIVDAVVRETKAPEVELVDAVIIDTKAAEEPENDDSDSNGETIDGKVTASSSDLDYGLIQDEEVDVITGQNKELDNTPLTQSPNIVYNPQTPEQDDISPSQGGEVDVMHLASPQCPVPDVLPQDSKLDTSEGDTYEDLNVVYQDSEVDTLETVGSVMPLGMHYVVGIMAVAIGMVGIMLQKAMTQAGQLVKKKKVNESEETEGISAQPTEVETVGFSGPAMSSSCKRSLSGQRGAEKMSETQQSHEKRLRFSRESLASSSSDYSYGSFTTFERIHARHGYGEEEVVTPVRRSSRIRKITSPSAV